MDYWAECIAEAFEDAGIEAHQEQVDIVVSWVEGAHENYGLATGHDCIPNPLALENDRLRKELKDEHEKVTCSTCNGKGRIITNFGFRSSDSQCWKCRGAGRIMP
jgi:hypothetical protein